MSEGKKLNELPTAASPLNLSMIAVDASGNLSRTYCSNPTPTSPDCWDADDAPPGWSRTRSTTTNLPANGNGGFLLTLQYDPEAKLQVFYQFDAGGPYLWIRRRANKEWQSWKQFQFVT